MARFSGSVQPVRRDISSYFCVSHQTDTLQAVDAKGPEPETSLASPPGRCPIFTIGYGARSPEDLIATIKANQIEYLIDVRTAPYSRFKPEFSKEVLQHLLEFERAGVRYVFMGDTLGGQPADPACQTDGKVDYDKVRAQSFFQKGVERLRKAFEAQHRVALMCSEGRPEQCHRSKLIGEALTAAGIPVCHIEEDGRRLTQTQVIDRLAKGQMDLFGHLRSPRANDTGLAQVKNRRTSVQTTPCCL